MSGLIIDTQACIGCGRCARACGYGGVVVEGPRGARLARPTDACVLCASCVDACPVGAISIERDAAVHAADLESYRDIWVFAQLSDDGRVLDVAFELLGRARELADQRGCRLIALLAEPSSAPPGVAERLAAAGVDGVVRCRDERFARLDAAVHAAWICGLARERRPEAILYGATVFGRELAPAVAVRLQTGLTADCTMLSMDGETGLLQQTRPAFGGNLMATITCPRHRPQMATVRPGIFPLPGPSSTQPAPIEDVELAPEVIPRTRILSREASAGADTITDADLLVVVGRGIGSKKNLGVARELASALGGKLGCTRPIVEAGWLEPWQQVGQTGVAVAPRVLLSLGVSGAIQHLAGISGAGTVIAVNDDPEAPIFSVARYRVVGDCAEVAGELLARLAR